MLTPEGKVKVMDFGIARAIADASSAMTQTAAVIGTAQYLSPEQARGETVDSRSDVYSTGCLLYELLTGRPPFVGESPVSVAYQHVREEARPPSQLNPDVSTAVDHIVAKALAKRTDDRYQSADEMRRDIERALAGHHVDAPTMAVAGLGAAAGATAVAPAAGSTGSMPPVSHRDDDERPDRKALWWGLGILAVILLAALGFALYQASQPEEATQVKVPDVTGQNVETATRALENAKFVVGETSEKTSSDVEKGQVISTDPEAGSEADEGSTVDLIVSSGPEQVEIPRLAGYTFDEAKDLLQSDQYGLKVKKSAQESNAPKDEVINSNPPEGTAVDKGSTVTLLVSKGQVTVPNVVGADQAAATKTLQDAGFKVKVVEDPNAQGPEGQVTAQSVPAGEQRSPGTTIDITVAAKPAPAGDGGDVLGGDGG
jgi:serine/threonine-protein kinase